MDVDQLKEIDNKLAEYDHKMCEVAAEYHKAYTSASRQKIIDTMNKIFKLKLALMYERHKVFIKLIVENEGKGKFYV